MPFAEKQLGPKAVLGVMLGQLRTTSYMPLGIVAAFPAPLIARCGVRRLFYQATVTPAQSRMPLSMLYTLVKPLLMSCAQVFRARLPVRQ